MRPLALAGHHQYYTLRPPLLVTKTFQHTYQHGDTLLRMGLWWRQIAAQIAAAHAGAGAG